MADNLFFDDAFIRKIDEAVMDDEHLADGASDELFRLRRSLARESDNLRDKLAKLTKTSGISEYLQDAIVTSRNGRYVVPVRAEHKKDVKGLVHDQSASGQTLFIEPEFVVEANNKIKQIEAEIKAEERRILQALSETAAVFTQDFASDVILLAYLDLVFAKAHLAGQMKASPPTFNADGILHIKQGRHPLGRCQDGGSGDYINRRRIYGTDYHRAKHGRKNGQLKNVRFVSADGAEWLVFAGVGQQHAACV